MRVLIMMVINAGIPNEFPASEQARESCHGNKNKIYSRF